MYLVSVCLCFSVAWYSWDKFSLVLTLENWCKFSHVCYYYEIEKWLRVVVWFAQVSLVFDLVYLRHTLGRAVVIVTSGVVARFTIRRHSSRTAFCVLLLLCILAHKLKPIKCFGSLQPRAEFKISHNDFFTSEIRQ